MVRDFRPLLQHQKSITLGIRAAVIETARRTNGVNPFPFKQSN